MAYTGKRNTTITGKQCKSWDNISHKMSFLSNFDLETSLNYCRDPSNLGYNWCYIENSKGTEQREPCQIEGNNDTEISKGIPLRIIGRMRREYFFLFKVLLLIYIIN
jgi:hypothetical protein